MAVDVEDCFSALCHQGRAGAGAIALLQLNAYPPNLLGDERAHRVEPNLELMA